MSSFEDGSSIPLVFITVWRMLVERANVQPGEWVLVNSAGSGVGIAAIQVAKLFGARVIATASTEVKRTKALGIGADGVVDYTKPGWADEVVRLADGRGVDVAIDSAGGNILDETLGTMAMSGRVVNCGFTAGGEWGSNWATFRSKRLSLMLTLMGSNSYLHETMKHVKTGPAQARRASGLPFREGAGGTQGHDQQGELRQDRLDLVAETPTGRWDSATPATIALGPGSTGRASLWCRLCARMSRQMVDDRNLHARRLFDGVATSYDPLAELFSFLQNGRWHRHIVSRLSPGPADRVLDLCTGTARRGD